MGRKLYIDTAIFSQLSDQLQSGYPEVYRAMDNGVRVANLEFIGAICRAYPYAFRQIGVPFERFSNSENTTAWSTPYFRAIRNFIPEYDGKYDVRGTGYKYRDVIWVVLALIKMGADSQIRNFRNLHRCLEVASDPADVEFLTASEIRTEEERNAQPIEPARPIERDETPAQVLPSIDPIEPAPLPKKNNTMLYLGIGAAALLGIILFGKKK